MSAIFMPSHGAPSRWPSSAKSLWRSRKSMLSEPEPADELRQQVQFFERAVRRRQRADGRGAVFGLHVRQRVRDVLERDAPVDLAPLVVLLDHRPQQPVGGVQALVREAVAVRQPLLVDVLVLERKDAHHALVLHLDDEVGADASRAG